MPRFPSLPRNVVATAILCGALVVTGSGSRPALAGPIDEAKAKAKAIAEQRLAIVETAERLNQRRQATSDDLRRLSQAEAVAMNEVVGRNKTLEASRANAAAVAVQAYLHGSQSPTLEGLVVVGHADTAPLREAYATTLYGDAGDAIDAARAARDDLQVAARALRDLIASRAELQASLDRDQGALEAKERELVELAARTDRTIETLVAEEQERLALEAEAEAKAEADRRAAETPKFTEPPVTARMPSAPQGVRPPAVAPKPASPKQAPSANPSKPAAPAPTVVQAPAPTKAPTTAPPTTRPAAPTTTRPTVTAADTPDPPPDEPTEPSPEPVPTAAPAKSAPRATTTVAKPTTMKAPPPKPIKPPPAPSSGAGAAVAEAKRQLGKPYKFGAVGPDSFDCSGLTQWAWAKGGVSMNHYTGSQYDSFPQVPLDQLQPGDLVFFRADLGHMGMYVGGGQFIHAPQTGDVVKISLLAGRSIVGAVRPG
jgi:peptidoglycan DL-endopeptidase CwlO